MAIVLPLFLGLMFQAPNPVWAGVLAAAVMVGAFEWARLGGFSSIGRMAFVIVLFLSCATLLLLYIFLPDRSFLSRVLYPLCLLATLFWIVVAPAALHFGWQVRNPVVLSLTGWLILVPTWLAAVVLQRKPHWLLLILGAVWLADTSAYLTGRRFGRHKLAPRVSPGKTIEGLLGAYVAVLIYVTIFLRIYLPEAGLSTYLSLLVAGFILTSLSVEGDLLESWFKRQAGAKDSGGLLPGHGGVLDRIDSATATLPFAVLFFAEAVQR